MPNEERDAAREAAEKIDSYLRNVQGHSVDGVADFIRSAISQDTRELREALMEISKADPQSEICGDNAPRTCNVGCTGCIARAALAKVRTA